MVEIEEKLTCRKYFTLPESFCKKLEKVTEELNTNFSEFARRAIEFYLDEIDKERTDHEVAEACQFYHNIDKEIAADWREAEGKIND